MLPYFTLFKGVLSGVRQFLVTERPLKMTKGLYSFIQLFQQITIKYNIANKTLQ